MELLKKYYKIRANSLLESVIALTIISICFYFAILIFATIFTPKTATKYYTTQNKINELFFLAQLQEDSLSYENVHFNMEEEIINEDLKKITIHNKDTSLYEFNKSFYIQNNNPISPN